LYLGLIINTKWKTRRVNGHFIKFDYNRALTLSDQSKFLGTRVYGPICKEIRNSKKKKKNYKKIISYSGATI
jgi:ribosomal protein L14